LSRSHAALPPKALSTCVCTGILSHKNTLSTPQWATVLPKFMEAMKVKHNEKAKEQLLIERQEKNSEKK
jgi:hypothetical protein